MRNGLRRRLGAIVTVTMLASCTATSPPAEPKETVPFAACGGLPVARPVSQLPDTALPCFAGGEIVHTGQLRGPVVLNFWASWCAGCRDELPAFQRLADSGKIAVVGVNSADRRAAAISLADDLGLRMPTLFDSDGALQKALGVLPLPLTVLVAADGKTTVYTGRPFTDEALAEFLAKAAV